MFYFLSLLTGFSDTTAAISCEKLISSYKLYSWDQFAYTEADTSVSQQAPGAGNEDGLNMNGYNAKL